MYISFIYVIGFCSFLLIVELFFVQIERAFEKSYNSNNAEHYLPILWPAQKNKW